MRRAAKSGISPQLIAALLSGVLVLLPFLSHASVVKPTTKMVWNGDLAENSTKGDLTLTNLNGNEITDDGFLKIKSGNKLGVQFNGENDLLNNCTIVIHGYALKLKTEAQKCLLSFQESEANQFSTANTTGVILKGKNTGFAAIANGNIVTDSASEASITTSNATFVVQYKRDYNRKRDDISFYEVLTNSTGNVETLVHLLDSSYYNDSPKGISGFTLGGVCPMESRENILDVYSTSPWTIQKLAVFPKILTEDEIKAYLKPRWKGFLLIIR